MQGKHKFNARPRNCVAGIVTAALIFVTLSVKTQLKSIFCDLCFQHKLILHKVKNILWKCNLHIFKIDWVRPCQRLKL